MALGLGSSPLTLIFFVDNRLPLGDEENKFQEVFKEIVSLQKILPPMTCIYRMEHDVIDLGIPVLIYKTMLLDSTICSIVFVRLVANELLPTIKGAHPSAAFS